MKKFFIVIGILFFLLVGLLEIVLPMSLKNILQEQIIKSVGAQTVDLSLSSSPDLKIALGDIEKIHCTADGGRIGDIDFKQLSLDGEKIILDVQELLFPSQDLSPQEHTDKILKSADKLELHGIITEDDLKSYLQRKVDRLENLEVQITPEEVKATGQIKIMGRMADIDLAGQFVIDDGDIYFRMTHLNVKNTLIRHVQLDRFLGDFKITEGVKLPMNLKFDLIEFHDKEILVTAVRN